MSDYPGRIVRYDLRDGAAVAAGCADAFARTYCHLHGMLIGLVEDS